MLVWLELMGINGERFKTNQLCLQMMLVDSDKFRRLLSEVVDYTKERICE